MTRLTYFILLGPFLIWLTFLALLSPLLARNGIAGIGEFLLVALVLCYAPGIIPMLGIAGLDELMSRYRVNVWLRVPVCGAAGFAATFALFYYVDLLVHVQKDYGLWLGLLGGLPAALCSWLSGRKQNQSAQGVSAA
jgi:hypothetical protein